MRRVMYITLTVMLVLTIILASNPQSVQANSGSWSAGTEVKINLETNPAPTWLQLLSAGVKVTESTKICHPFRQGQFNWVGQIMQLKDGKWTKITTVNDWVPSKEGIFMSCAQAPAAGTYALFGYYDYKSVKVIEPAPSCSYNTTDWWVDTDWDEGDLYFLVNFPDGFPKDKTVTLVVTEILSGSLISPLTTMTGTSFFNEYTDNPYATFYAYPIEPTTGFSAILRITSEGCTKDYTVTYMD